MELFDPPQPLPICATAAVLSSAPVRTGLQDELSIGPRTQPRVARSDAWLPRGKLGRLSESMLLSQGQKPPDKSRHEQAAKVEIDTSRLSDSAILALPIPSAQVQQIVMSFGTVIQALRSTQSPQDDRIKKDIAGIASNVDLARTEFRNGDVDGAIARIRKCKETLDRKAQQWKMTARQEMATRKSLSSDASKRMQVGHVAVTSRLAQALNQMSRLGSMLEQFRQSYQNPLEELEQLRRAHAARAAQPRGADAKVTLAAASPTAATTAESARPAPEVPVTRSAVELPDAFWVAFRSAPAQRKPTIVQQFFAVQTHLKVDLQKRSDDRYTPVFHPNRIPTNRFYFLTDPGKIVFLRGGEFLPQGTGGAVLHVHYPETGKDETMRLVDFVRHVQKGVWLLAEPAR